MIVFMDMIIAIIVCIAVIIVFIVMIFAIIDCMA